MLVQFKNTADSLVKPSAGVVVGCSRKAFIMALPSGMSIKLPVLGNGVTPHVYMCHGP